MSGILAEPFIRGWDEEQRADGESDTKSFTEATEVFGEQAIQICTKT